MLQHVTETAARPASVALNWDKVATPDARPLDLLNAHGTKMKVKRGQEICVEGERSEYCYRVMSGSVRLVKLMSDGRRQICEFLQAGDVLGFEIEDEHYFSAESLNECVLMRYPRRVVENLITENRTFARHVRQLAARGLQGAYQRMVLLCHKSAQERLAWFLLDMADRADSDTLQLSMTRSDIADYLGMVIETVSRTLSQLKQAGMITQQSLYCIRLTDRDALEELRGEV